MRAELLLTVSALFCIMDPVADAFAHYRVKRALTDAQRDVVGQLFQAYQSINRKVFALDNNRGYKAITTSRDPAIVTLIQTHVKQMADLVAAGNRTRQWDPAAVQLFANINDIVTTTTNRTNGVRVVVKGTTDEARAVACNHANGVSRFVQGGPPERQIAGTPVSEPWQCVIDPVEVINF